jgi:leucyl aminopeptidase
VLAKLKRHANIDLKLIGSSSHVLIVLQRRENLRLEEVPLGTLLGKLLARKKLKPEQLVNDPVTGTTDNGTLVGWVVADGSATVFEQQVQVRRAAEILLGENPDKLTIVVLGREEERHKAAELALYVAWINGVPLPTVKSKADSSPLRQITLLGHHSSDDFAAVRAKAEGNILCRQLSILPPNELTPIGYRRRLAVLAKQEAWKVRELDFNALRKMGAGAFVAVAQGSPDHDAAVVHLRYTHKRAKHTVALVGKGICFDTGGHNLKPARHMLGMHEDMNGSAVALGILLAATRMNLPVNIDCWLAIAQNHISPVAYKQNDVVKALNGTTIEIVHTDAEGRMVLADALTLAARQKPSMIVDFATLTGAMVYALGTRYSGVFSNRDELLSKAAKAGQACGERMNPFPLAADYGAALKSSVADTKQCLIAGEADHILGACFLAKFVDDLPWLHVDLSAAVCEGGLGAVATQTTGFGVAWGVEMLSTLLANG